MTSLRERKRPGPINAFTIHQHSTTKTTSAPTFTSTKQTTLTISWSDLQPWQQDNAFITTHYRPTSNSLLKSLHSLTYFHNETINVYSHLLGALLFLLTSHYLYTLLTTSIPPRYPTSTKTDILLFSCFFFGATTCLLMSATYHLLSNHSLKIALIGNKLDYLGIVLMISGSLIPSLHYGFPCHNLLFLFYTTQTIVLGLVCAILCLHPHFRTPPYRPVRAAMYVLYGSSGLIPVTHGVMVYGLEQFSRQASLPHMLLQGLLYVVGAGIYTARVPERWYPGRFDLVGASHQIFHFLVIAAASSQLVGLIKAFDYKHSDVKSGHEMRCNMWK